MPLEEITGSVELETAEYESKAWLDRTNVTGWLKTVGGFANAGGGVFYLGVEDKSNKQIGFTRKEADSERNYFNSQVNDRVSLCRSPPQRLGLHALWAGRAHTASADIVIQTYGRLVRQTSRSQVPPFGSRDIFEVGAYGDAHRSRHQDAGDRCP